MYLGEKKKKKFSVLFLIIWKKLTKTQRETGIFTQHQFLTKSILFFILTKELIGFTKLEFTCNGIFLKYVGFY